MKLSVIKLDGKAAGDVELSDAVFGISEIRGDILARTVSWQLAKRRAGTHKVQTRNENSRTGKKMYKQKAPAAPVTVRAVRRSSSAARAPSVRSFAITASPCRRRFAPWPCVTPCRPR